MLFSFILDSGSWILGPYVASLFVRILDFGWSKILGRLTGPYKR